MSAPTYQSRLPPSPADAAQLRHWLLYAIIVTTSFGALHHLDHALRGNHVGWPMRDEVNAFSYSLGMYPLILIGLIALWRGRLLAGYWLVVALIGLLTAGPTHIGPWAAEPVADIYVPYADPLFYCQTTAPSDRVAFFRDVYAPVASPLWAVLAVANMVSLLVGLAALSLTTVRVARRAGWWR
jgi:hypothetical protein